MIKIPMKSHCQFSNGFIIRVEFYTGHCQLLRVQLLCNDRHKYCASRSGEGMPIEWKNLFEFIMDGLIQ